MTVLVTGGLGCIGAWTLYHLTQAGRRTVCFDLGTSRHRLDALLPPDQQDAITFIQGDITDYDQVANVFQQHDITRVIHLAALQIPATRANPVLGARVNVVGSTCVFEAARQHDVSHIAYASSIAVYGARTDYTQAIIPHDAPKIPRTLYGAFKVADEGLAFVYQQDYGLTSVGLRPYTVYGVGRDQGLTSEPTKAMQAAANGESYHISFGGSMQFHYASDVARQFIAAADASVDGVRVYDLGTQPVSLQHIAELITDISGATVTAGDEPLAFPDGATPAPDFTQVIDVPVTPLRKGIEATIEHFRTH